MIIFWLFILIASTAVTFVTFVIFIDDIKTLKQRTVSADHPYASWRRARPPVTIYIVGTDYAAQAASVRSIKKLRHKQLSIITTAYMPLSLENNNTIFLPAGALLSQSGLVDALRTMNFRHVPIFYVPRQLRNTKTVLDIIWNYRAVHSELVTRIKNGIVSVIPHFYQYHSIFYMLGMFMQLFASLLFAYATYLALGVGESSLLFGLAAASSIYILITICMSRHLRWQEKLSYCLLSPVSYIPIYLIVLLNVIHLPLRVLVARGYYLSKFWRI